MSDKPTTKVINNKIVKSYARQKARANDPGPKTASQKNGFVVRKDSITKNAGSARHSEPFKLVASGAGHGVYPESVTSNAPPFQTQRNHPGGTQFLT